MRLNYESDANSQSRIRRELLLVIKSTTYIYYNLIKLYKIVSVNY